ncbi:hypothetical protein MA16_Dca003250 [Dendrobium catenatum]|uniref:Uncharacterized protein n=1 Tax=Dendrobium catenatum TaxID=906689 RepID=A0A2I0XC76_9ASPA|nr:hypothetical protein MA16_Dca003250 [Dendrobium catenatum]
MGERGVDGYFFTPKRSDSSGVTPWMSTKISEQINVTNSTVLTRSLLLPQAFDSSNDLASLQPLPTQLIYPTTSSRAQLKMCEEGEGTHPKVDVKQHANAHHNNEECSKLRMKLNSTQAKMDTYRRRLKEALDEMKVMHSKYQEASTNLKNKLRTYGQHILDLTKRLAEKE